mmetsp:Transcript_26570/g.56945  ORF Transcript_26570/g.56945 Transcript_26570/m.56945 type:complete len:270 (-) Transcript_26570:285-1094(-)
MTASKRKNENLDDVVKQTSRVVIVGDQIDEEEKNGNNDSHGDQQQPDAQLTTIEKMKKLREQWEQERLLGFDANAGSGSSSSEEEDKPYDAIAEALGSVVDDNKTDVALRKSLSQQAEDIKSKLSKEINEAKDLYRKESNVLGELSRELSKFRDQRQKLLREIDELDYQQRVSQEKIARYQEEASQELEMIMDVEDEQKRQVPRLKMAISLYASTTGIKWDFADPDLLSGQVDIPSQKSFKLFSIDPRDFDSVETADILWNLSDNSKMQ